MMRIPITVTEEISTWSTTTYLFTTIFTFEQGIRACSWQSNRSRRELFKIPATMLDKYTKEG